MNRQRLLAPFVACFLLFVLLGTRLFWIQIFCHETLGDLAERQHRRLLKTPATRGMITDRTGHVLAMSLEVPSCWVDVARLRDPARVADTLSRLLGQELDWRKWLASPGRRGVWIARRLSPAVAQDIESRHWPGVEVVWEPQRVYPEGELACHVLGVVGTDQQGLAGIEFSAERALRGTSVQYQVGRDALGRTIAARAAQDPQSTPAALSLTIDRTLQYLAEQALDQGIREARAKRGVMVVEDPSTGELLALVNRPGFDPNQWRGELPMLSNAAVSEIFEPGSTFKLVTAAVALEEQLVQWDEHFFCENGQFIFEGFTIHDHEPRGDLPFHQVMAYSSNVGMAKLGLRLGKERFYRMARAFGFGSFSGSGLPGESQGMLRHPGRWSRLSLPMMAFGQEVGVTALQMVNAYTAVANGGLLLEPQVVRGVQPTEARWAPHRPVRPIRRVCSSRTCTVLTQLLEEALESGTGTKARVAGYRAAGKTGTAQKFDREFGRYSPTRYLSSFCGFLPVEAPRLVIGVFIDEPQGVSWGGEVAAPVFAQFAAQAMPYLGVHPTTPLPQPTLASAAPSSRSSVDLP